MAQRWKQAPAGGHWGEFGPDDQRGRMNLVTPREGAAGHRRGEGRHRTFCLACRSTIPGGQVLNPRRIAPRRVRRRDGSSDGKQFFCWPLCRVERRTSTDVVCDDLVLMSCSTRRSGIQPRARRQPLRRRRRRQAPRPCSTTAFGPARTSCPAATTRQLPTPCERYPRAPRRRRSASSDLAEHGAQGAAC